MTATSRRHSKEECQQHIKKHTRFPRFKKKKRASREVRMKSPPMHGAPAGSSKPNAAKVCVSAPFKNLA